MSWLSGDRELNILNGLIEPARFVRAAAGMLGKGEEPIPR